MINPYDLEHIAYHINDSNNLIRAIMEYVENLNDKTNEDISNNTFKCETERVLPIVFFM